MGEREKCKTLPVLNRFAVPYLSLQEAPQRPLLLDALATDIHGHTERQDDHDEEAANDAGRDQRCPVQR